MKISEIGISRMLFIKLEPNDGILESLTEAVVKNSIKTGFFTAIGAVQNPKIGYYKSKEGYQTIELVGNFEVLSCVGNVTLKETIPMIHAHIVVGDLEGHAFGGHLIPGNHISVTGEIFLVESQKALTRALDPKFQLSLINLE